MNETRLLRRVIHYLWECYRERGEMKIRLTNHQGDQLHVEEGPEHWLVAVRYYAKEPTGELVKQVEVICFIMRHGAWVPLQMFLAGGLNMIYARGSSEDGEVEILDRGGHIAAVGYCDAWSFQLLEEGFLAQAAKMKPIARNPQQRPKWPTPTVPAPDLEQLEDWQWEDAGCEATDGCWQEIDGVCPHDHPSWLLRLGLV
jgi:hypothetical protein